MKIGKLNFGGIFGGLVCAAAAFAIIYLLANRFPMGGYKAVALAAFCGAALGNWIWGLAVPPPTDDSFWAMAAGRTENRENS